MGEDSPRKLGKVWKPLAVVGVVVALAAAVSYGYVLNPALSPAPTIRDTDGDGVADADDVFPDDPGEWLDSDEDGIGNNGDAFPNDPSETEDTDGDGVGDNGDEFPSDASEWEDSDGDGVGNNADFWDSGNGGLRIQVELFEILAGSCDVFSNCEPSIRLELDYEGDEVTDIFRRADFEDFLDSEQLVNPVFWVIDVPEDTQSLWVIVYVMELDVGGEGVIDVDPDDQYIASWFLVESPFAKERFDTQGNEEPIGHLVYTVEAVVA